MCSKKNIEIFLKLNARGNLWIATSSHPMLRGFYLTGESPNDLIAKSQVALPISFKTINSKYKDGSKPFGLKNYIIFFLDEKKEKEIEIDLPIDHDYSE